MKDTKNKTSSSHCEEAELADEEYLPSVLKPPHQTTKEHPNNNKHNNGNELPWKDIMYVARQLGKLQNEKNTQNNDERISNEQDDAEHHIYVYVYIFKENS